MADSKISTENSVEIKTEVVSPEKSQSITTMMSENIKTETTVTDDSMEVKSEVDVSDASDLIKSEIKTESEEKEETVTEKGDPYSYTKLSDFTSENSVQIKTEVVSPEKSHSVTTMMSENIKTETTETDDSMEVKSEVHVSDASDLIKSEIQTESEEKEETESEKHDPYSYTRLSDFTSEIYKIEINNLPNYVGYGQLRKLLHSTLKLNPRKIKAIGSPPHFVFTTFRNEEDRDKALNLLNGYVWKGRTLVAKKANPAADPMVQKRKTGDSEDCPNAKKLKEEDIPVELKLKNAVTPYWNIPYLEQLQMKEDDVRKFLVKLSKTLDKTNKYLKPLLQKNRKEHRNQCCPLTNIKPSPVTSAYRNKCEFTAGRHLETKEKTVGFRLNSYKAGSMSVAEPDDCINMSSVMLKAVKSFQDYIRASDKDVYNPENHAGYWRQLTVRTSNNDDVLLIIVIHPQSLSDEELNEEKAKLKQYYETGPGSNFGITSVYFQLFAKRECSEESPNLTHLMGKEYLEETLLGMKFEVSPESFFQINVPATEVLYSMVSDYAQATSDATVLDVCCGTGTISLCLAKAGAKVIGIEMCPQAVENARRNAQNNGVTNVEFICGKAEDVILRAIYKCDSSDIIAVVDPPRAGLHQKVLKVIRGTSKIKKLIYISCNPNSAFNNFVDLCRPPSNNYKGRPFYPIEAAVVDMFPHTPHKELVLIFERCP